MDSWVVVPKYHAWAKRERESVMISVPRSLVSDTFSR